MCEFFFNFLTKSLLPLPDKYHGLTDINKRYRQRYVDMIANPEVADVFRRRAKIVSEISKTVESFGYLEVETPVLQGAAGGAEARPFVTFHNSLGRDVYLRIATELHLKRMLVLVASLLLLSLKAVIRGGDGHGGGGGDGRGGLGGDGRGGRGLGGVGVNCGRGRLPQGLGMGRGRGRGNNPGQNTIDALLAAESWRLMLVLHPERQNGAMW